MAINPHFQAAGTAVAGIGNVSPSWPTHIAGDVALLFVESHNEAIVLGTPAGFVELDVSPKTDGLGDTRLAIFWCRATSAAMTAPTVTDPGDHVAAQILTFRGCRATGTPYYGAVSRSSSGAGTSHNLPSVNATEVNCLYVGALSISTDGDSTTNFSAWTNALIPDLTEIADFRTVQGDGGGFGVVAGHFPQIGRTGTTSVTVSASTAAAEISLLLYPETPVVGVDNGGEGHAVDASTLALWRLDEPYASTQGGTLYELVNNIDMTNVANERQPGFTDGPVAGTFARVYQEFVTDKGQGSANGAATTAALQTVLIGSWCVEAFIRVDSLPAAGTFHTIISHSGTVSSETAANNSLMEVGYNENGKLRAFWESGAGTDVASLQVAGGALAAGTWYHVGFVKDSVANNMLFYINGVLQDTIAYASEPDTGTSGALRMGNNGLTPTRHANCTLRSVHLSSTTRDATWLLANAARLSTTALNLTDASSYAHWRMDDTPVAIDSGTAKLHLRDEGASSTVNISYPTGFGGLISDGGRGRMVYNAAMACAYNAAIRAAMLADFTFEGWFNFFRPIDDASLTTTWGLFCHGDPGSEAQEDNYFAARVLGDGSIQVDWEHGAGSSTGSNFTTDPFVVPFGVATHIAIRRTDTGSTWTCDVFVNGVSVHTATGLTDGDGSNNPEASYFRIGQGNVASTAGTFTVDDVRISSVARTSTEILNNYLAGQLGAGGPTISNPVPLPGDFGVDREAARLTAVGFLYTKGAQADADTEPCIYATIGSDTHLVYDAGGFTSLFASRSTVTVVGREYTFSILPAGGWWASPTIQAGDLNPAAVV